MKTYRVDLVADVEMAGNEPQPPVLTTRLRPNFVVGEHYCLCFVLETAPAAGIGQHCSGSFRAHVVCGEEALPLFVKDGKFELRSAKRMFATGHFREIVTINKAEPAP